MIKIAILTISDTRNKSNDDSAKAIMEILCNYSQSSFPSTCGEGSHAVGGAGEGERIGFSSQSLNSPPLVGGAREGGRISFEISAYDIVKDDKQAIKDILIHYADSLCVDVVFTTGGTGLSPRDVTPEATAEVIDRQVPGISEFIRLEGLHHTEKSVLSRGISGIRKNSLIINLPGSPKGARESLNTVLKILPHAISMLKGEGHGK